MNVLNTPRDPRHEVPNPMASGWLRTIPLAAIILSFAVVSFYYGSLPEQIPIHFGPSGEADAYGHKLTLWILPALNLGLFYFLGAIPGMGFKHVNYPVAITEANAAEQHRLSMELTGVLRLVCCLMIAFIIYSIIMTARAGSGNLNMWVMGLFMAGIFVPIIYYYRRAKLAA